MLTSVGLEHTEWLGETEQEIAGEKLAVLRDHSTLVVGRLGPAIEALAVRAAAERGARLVRATAPDAPPLATPGPYPRRNFAVALAAAEAVLGPLDPERVHEVAARVDLPGRMQVLAGDPPLILDAAHNPDGARALAEALPDATGGRPVFACMAALADKDAAGIIEALAGRLAAIVCTEVPPERLAGAGRPGAASHSAESLAALARAAGLGEVQALVDPRQAVGRALALAAARDGVALVAGSHYLLSYAAEVR